jgi:hypothetical protein
LIAEAEIRNRRVGDGGVSASVGRAGMAGDPLALVEDLDRL